MDAPERIWLGHPSSDGEAEVWFESDEGGTEYVRADLHARLAVENERLQGLLWYAWSEFNAIRARHGAPIARDLIPTCDEAYWSQLTDAFAAAIGPNNTTPWPSDAARAALTGGSDGE